MKAAQPGQLSRIGMAGAWAALGFAANLACGSPDFEALIDVQTSKWYGQFHLHDDRHRERHLQRGRLHRYLHIDALLENAVRHTVKGDVIKLSVTVGPKPADPPDDTGPAGLGGVVQAHGGDVLVRSWPGPGSEFELLPAYTRQTQTQTRSRGQIPVMTSWQRRNYFRARRPAYKNCGRP
jgi:hypothetical protein